jgi:hypothetical protein
MNNKTDKKKVDPVDLINCYMFWRVALRAGGF